MDKEGMWSFALATVVELLDSPTTDGSPIAGLALALSRCCCSSPLIEITSAVSGLVLGNCSAADPCSRLLLCQVVDSRLCRGQLDLLVLGRWELEAFKRQQVLPSSSSD
ncbi:mercuric transport protein [Striga asiatica]|uniref:Mercuric transport protein n=1 Tax=Striga asiatica TaxID=4170 RepID=A0A5A7PTF4_STRAF|nr:mercuric transport protein [Striga asiatica]